MKFKTVSKQTLEKLAGQKAVTTEITSNVNAAKPISSPTATATDSGTWLDEWIGKYFPEAAGKFRSREDGRLVQVDCPFNQSHVRKAYIGQFKNGAIYAGCQSQSCKDKKWQDFKAIKEGVATKQPPIVNSQNALAAAPIPLERAIKNELPTLDEALIAPVLLPHCKDVSYRMQAPLEYAITSLLTGFGALLGNKFSIYPKDKDNWRVVANIWGIIVGDAGSLKTPVITDTSKYIKRLDDDLAYQQKQLKKQHHISVKALEAQMKVMKQTNTKQNPTSNPNVIQQLTQLEIQLQDLKDSAPPERRIIVKDATVEKLGELLADNGNGMYFLLDELINLLKTLEKQGHENDRGFLLEAWNGINSYTFDRILRGSTKIDKVCLSILGTIQPTVLKKYVNRSLSENVSDGLLSRFQIVLFPPKAKQWQYVNQAPDAQAEKVIQDLVNFCYQWQPQSDNNQWKYKQPNPGEYGVVFDAKAQAFFEKWLTKLMNHVSLDEDMAQPIKEQLSKYPALMAKLSLICHVLEHAYTGSIPTDVSEINAVRAAAWCEHLEPHAERMYNLNAGSLNENKVLNAAIAILDKVAIGKFNCKTVNDITRKNWGHCKKEDETYVTQAVELLAQNNWLTLNNSTATNNGGRPTTYINLHPQISQYVQNKSQYLVEIEAEARETPYLDLLKTLLNPPQQQRKSSANVTAFLHLANLKPITSSDVPFEIGQYQHLQFLAIKAREQNFIF
jgi:hypothetical protein